MTDFAIPPREPNPDLYRAVVASPDDDAPRHAYADWCEANREPDRARFIRAQLRLARMPPGHPEAVPLHADVALEHRHDDDWLFGRPTAAGELRWEYLRGFPEAVYFTSARSLKLHGDGAFRYFVRRLGFVNLRSVRRLAASPLLARARELDLGRAQIDDAELAALAASPHAAGLEYLRFGGWHLTAAGAAALADADLPALRGLEVEATATAAADGIAAAFGRGPLLGRLEKLLWREVYLTDAGLVALAGAAELTDLSLLGNNVTAAGLAAVAHRRAWPKLRTLEVFNNRVGDAGAEAVAAGSHWSALRWLTLSRGRVGSAGAAALAGAAHLGRLEGLLLPNNLVGDAGGRALARSRALASLRHLDLSGNALPPALLSAITRAVNQRDPSALDALDAAPLAPALPAAPPLPIGKATRDEAGLLQAIADDPDDDLPRLVYADWHEENGDLERAEWIRRQVALAAPEGQLVPPADLPRWVGDLASYVQSASFDRGVLSVTMAMRKFLLKAFQADGARLLESAGVRGLWLDGTTADWPRLAASPALAGVRELTVNRASLNVPSLAALANSPHLANVYSLTVASDRRPWAGLATLFSAPLPRLRRLGLPGLDRPVGNALAALLAWPGAARLSSLDLTNQDLRDVHAAMLAELPGVAGLRRLNLSGNYFLPEGVAALAASPHLAGLRRLSLNRCGLRHPASARALAESPSFQGLEVLSLCYNPISDDSALMLADSPNLANLHLLILSRANVTAECGRELTQRHGNRVRLQ